MSITLSTATVSATFPSGTVDTPWTFTITGTNPDSTPYTGVVTSATPSAPAPSSLIPGAVVTMTVSKNGVSSMVSDPFTVPAGDVTLSVPDATQKAIFTVV